jgi:hypothetical protein
MGPTHSAYPTNLDVFLPLLDGLHPIGSDDLNLIHEALENIESTLGYGPTDGVTSGPKAGNASVRERLDTFLEDYGGLRDVAFVTGTAALGQFCDLEPAGFFVGFGKSLSSQDYTVLFTALQGEKEGTAWSRYTPAIVWISPNGRTPNGVFLQAMAANGERFVKTDDRTVTFAVLAFGPKATY